MFSTFIVFIRGTFLVKYLVCVDFFFQVYLFQPSYTIQVCPEMAVLERYSTTKCSNRRIYHCLVEDSNGFNNYREECRTPEWVSLGIITFVLKETLTV